MKKYIMYILAFFVLTSCEKENLTVDNTVPDEDSISLLPVYDTVPMGEYFPAYPNSYWIYLNLDGDTVIHKTDTIYSLHSNYHPYQNPYDTTKYYACKYDGRTVKKYELSVRSNHYVHETSWETILPDNLYEGNLFLKHYSWPYTYSSGRILKIDTTVMLNSTSYDSVIIVLEYLGPGIGCVPHGKTYYAKNIGIIKKETCTGEGFDKITSQEILLNYHIEK